MPSNHSVLPTHPFYSDAVKRDLSWRSAILQMGLQRNIGATKMLGSLVWRLELERITWEQNGTSNTLPVAVAIFDDARVRTGQVCE